MENCRSKSRELRALGCRESSPSFLCWMLKQPHSFPCPSCPEQPHLVLAPGPAKSFPKFSGKNWSAGGGGEGQKKNSYYLCLYLRAVKSSSLLLLCFLHAQNSLIIFCLAFSWVLLRAGGLLQSCRETHGFAMQKNPSGYLHV